MNDREAQPRFLTEPILFALTVSADELFANGFGRADIQALFDWQDGKTIVTDLEQIRRFELLNTFVIRTVTS